MRKYYGYSHIIDCPIDSVKSPFGCSPLLYHNHWPVSKFWDRSTKLLLRKNIALSFENIEHKEPLCRIYPDKVGGGSVSNELSLS